MYQLIVFLEFHETSFDIKSLLDKKLCVSNSEGRIDYIVLCKLVCKMKIALKGDSSLISLRDIFEINKIEYQIVKSEHQTNYISNNSYFIQGKGVL